MSSFATDKKTSNKSSLRDGSRYTMNTPATSKKGRISFRPRAMLRQSSAKDENGDTIPGTATLTYKPHCPISKNAFFDKIPDMVNNSDFVDEEIIRKKLEKARMHGVSVLKGAIWVKSYLEQKIMYLEQNRGLKVGIGQYKLAYVHTFIIQKILELVEKIVISETVHIEKEAAEEAAEEAMGISSLAY